MKIRIKKGKDGNNYVMPFTLPASSRMIKYISWRVLKWHSSDSIHSQDIILYFSTNGFLDPIIIYYEEETWVEEERKPLGRLD